MYKPQAGSPSTKLTTDITDVDTEIEVLDVTVLPDPPNILTLVNGNDFESIIYEATDEINNLLQNVTRGVEGTAQSWSAEQEIARYFTAKDLLDIQSALDDLAIMTIGEIESSIIPQTTLGEIESSIIPQTTLGEIESSIIPQTTLGEIESEIMSATTN
jgi:hypothetical protein